MITSFDEIFVFLLFVSPERGVLKIKIHINKVNMRFTILALKKLQKITLLSHFSVYMCFKKIAIGLCLKWLEQVLKHFNIGLVLLSDFEERYVQCLITRCSQLISQPNGMLFIFLLIGFNLQSSSISLPWTDGPTSIAVYELYCRLTSQILRKALTKK